MLVDDLLACSSIGNISEPSHMRNKLVTATKFALAMDFTAMAEHLCEDFKAISKAVPFCRLPYRFVWLEVAQQERPRYRTAPIHIPEYQRIPKRVGFLLEGDEKLTMFKAHMFWSFAENILPVCSELAMSFVPARATDDAFTKSENRVYFHIESSRQWNEASEEVKSIISTTVQPEPADFPNTMSRAIMNGDFKQAQFLFELASADWSGEHVFILAALALMNTTNVHQTELVSQHKLNKSRVKHGKPPLQDYHVLKIHTELKKRYANVEGSGNPRDLRWHLVRGHWKVRRTGVFFWHPFSRGDAKHGKVHKDYEVEP